MAGVKGISLYQPFARTVTSASTTAWDGWTKVAALKGSDLGTGSIDYAFVVWANIGGVSVSKSSPTSLIEIAFGDGVTPFGDSSQSVAFNASTFFNRQAVGYHCVRVYEAGGRGAWNTLGDVCVWARIHSNSTTKAVGGFQVADVTIHAFNLSKFTSYATGYHAGLTKYGGATTYTSLKSFPSSTFKATKNWLVFHSLRYAPGANSKGRCVGTIRYRPNKAVTGFGVGDPNWLYKFGFDCAEGRAAIGFNWVPSKSGQQYCMFSGGGFSVIDTDASDPDPDIEFMGYCALGANNAGEESLYFGADYFAIDSTELEDFQHLEIWNNNFSAGNTGPPGGDPLLLGAKLHNQGGVPLTSLVSEPFESSRFEAADTNVAFGLGAGELLFSLGWIRPVGPANPHHLGATIDRGNPRHHVDYMAQFRSQEHYETLCSFRRTAMPKGATTSNLWAWGTGSKTGGTLLSKRLHAICWDWADDPNRTKTTAPPAGATVEIHPGYEAFVMGSLTEITVEPEGSYNEREFDPKTRLETDLGYEPTWPRNATPRNQMTLRFSGLTIQQRDTLVLFFSAEATRTFKWTRPGDTAIALAATGKLQSGDQGNGKHSAQIDVVELLYLGGTP